MALQVRSEEALTRLIDPAAEPHCSGAGYEFTEGPVWSARESRLYFQRHPRRHPLALDRGAAG